MDLPRYLHDRIEEYEQLIYALAIKHNTGQGAWGKLAPLQIMQQVRPVFVSRTRGCFSGLRTRLNIEQAYRELRTLLKHPIAQEIELITESVKQ